MQCFGYQVARASEGILEVGDVNLQQVHQRVQHLAEWRASFLGFLHLRET